MANNAGNVSTAKPAVAGAIHRAPAGTTLPTTADETLATGFKGLGYVSDDGATNSDERESEEVKAWGGDTVAAPQTGFTDKFKYKLIESLNTDVLKAVYGDGNVSGTLASGLTVKVNAKEQPEASWVIDTILTGDVKKRMVIPKGKLTEKGEVVYKDNEPIGYEVTITAFPDTDGNTHYEYLKAPSSSGSGGGSGSGESQ